MVFSIRSNGRRFNEGRRIEGIGISPHVVTPYRAEDLLNGVDTQIRQAEQWLGRGLPKDLVPWEAERQP